MYSKKVTEFQITTLEKKANIKLKCYSPSETDDFCYSINKIKERADKEKKDANYGAELNGFMRNEVLLSKYDFHYWLKYCKIALDGCMGGGVGPFKLWKAQTIVMDLIEKIEEESFDLLRHNEPSDGIRIADHKSRQLGGTALCRALGMHRLTLHANQRAIGASIDKDKILELYDRDKIIYDNLPFWLQPSLTEGYDVKASHIRFAQLGSFILYQDSQQTTGMGQGRQFEVCHLTECSAWKCPEIDIELMVFPTLPQSHMCLAVLESQPLGRGNWWHKFTERVRSNKVSGWKYIFVPWYAEPMKYRRKPSVNWKPSEATLAHAWRVFETSAEFLGSKITLGREQLYWYETTRQSYVDSDTLQHFLTSYAATPEESFQHSTQSGFSVKVLETMENHVRKGLAFDLFKLQEA